MTDKQIIEDLRSGDLYKRNQVLSFLYTDKEFKKKVVSLLMSKGGKQEQAKVFFEDGIIAFVMHISKGNKTPHQGIRPYITSICKYMLFKSFKAKRNEFPIDDEFVLNFEKNEVTPVTILLKKDTQLLVTQVLSELGEPCATVLTKWSYGYKMKEIAEQLGYKTDAVARKKKHQCWKKLLELINTKPVLKTTIRNMTNNS